MKAYRMLGWQQKPVLVDLPTPRPKPGEVLMRVAAAGVCHSDVNICNAPANRFPWKFPFTLGHETAGWVESCGSGVTHLRAGEPVIVYPAWACGACANCRDGQDNYCEQLDSAQGLGCGMGRDGGLAEFLLVPSSRYLVPLGKLDPLGSAWLGCAALTAYHAVKTGRDLLGPESTALVIGVGAVGQAAIQILKAVAPAKIVALDRDPRKLGVGKKLGAQEALLSEEPEVERKVRELTGGRGADLILDLVGSDQSMAFSAKVLRRRGRILLVGLSRGTFPLGFWSLPYGGAISTVYWGGLKDLAEVVALANSGRLSLASERFALSRVSEAFHRLESGEVLGRALVTMAGGAHTARRRASSQTGSG